MSTAKRQHYVPRCLLKHFCADGQTINVTDLKTNKTYQTNITNVAQDSRQVFSTVIWDILADPPQANVPHAANARRIQHLQKYFGAFTTKTDCKYLWHVITIADLRQNRNRGLLSHILIQEPQHFCNMFKICRFFYGL